MPELKISDANEEQDHSAVLWYAAEQSSKENPIDTNLAPNTSDTSNITIDVLLFGLLSTVTNERQISFSLPNSATPMDVLTALEERFGEEAFAQIKDPTVGILPCCRIFVDNQSFEDVYAPISPDGTATTVEMIVIKGFEGG